jgi:hypothetical protein
MDTSKALEIVRALADGTDPYTGEVYPPESPYQNAETVRALFTAIDALERAERRKKRKRALPERAGQPWDDEEDSVLIKRFKEGVGVKEIAVEHKRTEGAILSRLEKLGKILRE